VLQNDPPTTLRHWQAWIPMLSLIVITTWWVIELMFPLTQGSRDAAWTVFPLLAIIDGAGVRALFLRLTLGPDGACAHNFLRNRSVAWADQADVHIKSKVENRFAKRYYWIELEPRSGRKVPVRGLTSYSEEVLENFVSRIVKAVPPGTGPSVHPVRRDQIW
jgi:hypothetical protein